VFLLWEKLIQNNERRGEEELITGIANQIPIEELNKTCHE
jgi:hypothetical protein